MLGRGGRPCTGRRGRPPPRRLRGRNRPCRTTRKGIDGVVVGAVEFVAFASRWWGLAASAPVFHSFCCLVCRFIADDTPSLHGLVRHRKGLFRSCGVVGPQLCQVWPHPLTVISSLVQSFTLGLAQPEKRVSPGTVRTPSTASVALSGGRVTPSSGTACCGGVVTGIQASPYPNLRLGLTKGLVLLSRATGRTEKGGEHTLSHTHPHAPTHRETRTRQAKHQRKGTSKREHGDSPTKKRLMGPGHEAQTLRLTYPCVAGALERAT